MKQEYWYKFTYDNGQFTEVRHCIPQIDLDEAVKHNFYQLCGAECRFIINMNKVVTIEEREEKEEEK